MEFSVLDVGGGPFWVGGYQQLDREKFLRTLGENGTADKMDDNFNDNIEYYKKDIFL